jgi:hypothetical protein
MRLTLPIISMVITLLYLLKYSAGQWNTLVNFGAALLALGGQFSVGVNSNSCTFQLSALHLVCLWPPGKFGQNPK